jgi:hypothetical protein
MSRSLPRSLPLSDDTIIDMRDLNGIDRRELAFSAGSELDERARFIVLARGEVHFRKTVPKAIRGVR